MPIDPLDSQKAFQEWIDSYPPEVFSITDRLNMKIAFIGGALWMNEYSSKNVMRIVREELQCSKK